MKNQYPAGRRLFVAAVAVALFAIIGIGCNDGHDASVANSRGQAEEAIGRLAEAIEDHDVNAVKNLLGKNWSSQEDLLTEIMRSNLARTSVAESLRSSKYGSTQSVVSTEGRASSGYHSFEVNWHDVDGPETTGSLRIYYDTSADGTVTITGISL